MKSWARVLREHPIRWVLFACLLVGLFLAVRNLISPEQDSILSAIRQAGYPVTLEDLNAYYPAVADDQNAAVVYRRAFQFDLFTNNIYDGLGRDLSGERGQVVPEDVGQGLETVLATNALAWQLLYSATNYPASRYPLDMREGYMVLLPHLAKIRRATTLLSLEGFACASRGDTNAAYAAFNAAVHAGDSVREEPILISFLVRIACWSVVTRRLEQSLNLVAFQEAQLRDLQQEFAAAEESRWPARALAGERAFGLSFFIDRHIQQSMTHPQNTFGGAPSGLLGRLALLFYRISGLMTKDRDFYLDAMGKSVARAELSSPERIEAGPPPSMTTSNRFLFFSRMMLPALSSVLNRVNEHSARMRVVQTALGVERFRMAHSGALPGNLQQLAPQFLFAVPLDPFDSQPIRYKRLPHGYVVYSIGADRHDDGGAEPPPATNGRSSTKSKSTPTDLTFVVERNP